MDGKDIGFWVGGHAVYGVCVVVANVVLVFKFNNYTGWGEVLAFGCTLSYFTLLFLENLLLMFPQVFLIFDTAYRQPMLWIGTFLSVAAVVVLELFGSRLFSFGILGKRGQPVPKEPEHSSELAGLISQPGKDGPAASTSHARESELQNMGQAGRPGTSSQNEEW